MDNTKQKFSTPAAIVVAGVLIMVGILLTNSGNKVAKVKTLSEQVGVSKTALAECVSGTDKTTLAQKIQTSVEAAMKGVPADQRGTPYAVVVNNSTGLKTEIRGADSLDNVKKLITEVTSGTVTTKYTGDLPPVDPTTEHILGSTTAPVTIVEYSDYECPYCKAFHPTLTQLVTESSGGVSWVYRHWPIHQGSFDKLVAAECVAKIKGNDAFWKYTDLLFGLLQTQQAPAANL